ncbi:redox-regulated ATPase YchF [Haloferax mediterranei ATCC 33500]|uniref:GTPase n=2 Tax=Haloferacaceae TaxID=1644056 RepID=I3R8N4_HALMT|nr:redox-regulated ATPase YchF [Haloferax mediterranei]AFK20594.1 translation-associated GTPase [Haloferax mediterranei ATCC 33500]AHZ23948.1 GTPase [Haloferax mediterranei ATCC 33500]ELZ98376.1 translation-associated GTPase [Haloferax mediterranei ATCC 33500]MDX5986651.1 redox-regulated ATPase YchF [Haloferax mediterranei ATCC 33500]QCQ75983.1 redox-regulated ATPase YchF [Haloferax mediterranei ATCC 33500]
MSYKIGLVGKPSVGKSSFFNAATMNDVPEGAYPFTTIDPSIGEAYVRVECAAPEFDESCTPSVGYCSHGMRYVPVKLVDVAGLIPGAHEGKGLGNQFLTDLNEADVLVHVVDFSGETDIEGEATEGHDPRDDIDFLENELDMWYLGILEKGIDRYRSGYHGEEKDIEVDLAEQMSAFKTNKDEIKQVILSLDIGLDPDEWDDEDKAELAREIRKRTKPIIIAANKMDKPVSQENFEEITTDEDYEHLTFVPTSAHAEKALKNADEGGVVDYRPGDDDFDIVGDVSDEQEAGLEQIREFVTEYGGTGVQQSLENALFDVMGAIAIFPGSANGKSDSQGVFRDCFILPEGSTTEDFAYHLHSDIGDGLLHGIDCHSKRQIGSDHELTHRDVVEIVSTN